MGEKDITEKTLASYNDVSSDIVNGLLFDGRPVVDPDSLSDVTPYSVYKADGRIHEQERDVSKLLKTAGNTENEIRIIADFIAHKRADPDYVSTDRTAFVHTDEVLKLMSLLTDDDRYELTLNSEGGKPKNMCEMLDRVEARGVEKGMAKGRAEGMEKGMAKGRAEGMEKGMAKGEDMVIALLRKLTPGSEDFYKALNASPEERRELYKNYGIA